jgi:DnaJ-class molecular chaperone
MTKTKVCPKCEGSGLYCMGTLDGRPFSPTGTTCWKCNGTGRIVSVSSCRWIKCKVCGRRVYEKSEGNAGNCMADHFTFQGVKCVAQVVEHA